MPQYYLHYDNGELLRDEVGQQLAGDDEARDAVRVAASEFIGEQIASGTDVKWSNRILLESAGKIIFVFKFSSILNNAEHSPDPKNSSILT